MKSNLIYVALLIMGILGISLMITHPVKAYEVPRFELKLKEYTNTDLNHKDTYIERMEVWHDKESGAEFVCFIGDTHGNPSCVPTLRNWK